jgi:Xaa-Pro aminopeptidase
MREHRLDAFVVSLLSNVRYLSGFSGSHGLAVITASDAWFLTDSRYRAQAAEEVQGFRRIITQHDLWLAVGQHGILKRSRRVAFESDAVTYAQYSACRTSLGKTTLVPTRELVEGVALTKDAVELASIRRAIGITGQVLYEVIPYIHPGVSESEIAAEISFRHRRLGADGDAFDPIVASGERSALPHAKASDKNIKNGEVVTIDIGCRVDGYCSDLTRTVVVGRASREQRKVYAAVLAAQQEAIAVARAGMAAAELDGVARGHIAAEGYGKFFIHSLGHGIGLNIHERPRVSHLSSERLRVGSVITIEPGIYLPERFGVRIEDDIVLTSSGCTVLSDAPRDLLIL